MSIMMDDAEEASVTSSQTPSLGSSSASTSARSIQDVDRIDLFYELMEAIERDLFDVLKSLLKVLCLTEVCKLDPRVGASSYGLSPLHVVRSARVGELLIDFGVPVDVRGVCTITPLMMVVQFPDAVELLINKGANVNCITRDSGTALHSAALGDHVESAEMLIKAGAEVNKRDAYGNTPLHMVDSPEMGELLVENGADIEALNHDGNMPLEEIVKKGTHRSCMEVAAYLLDVAHERSRSRTAELLDLLQSHVLSMTSGKPRGGSTSSSGGIVVPLKMGSGSDSADSDEEERFMYEEGDENDGAADKWSKVKGRLLRRKTKVVRISRAEKLTEEQREDFLRGAQLQPQFARQSSSGSIISSSHSNPEFLTSFFELMVRERPELALRILDKQRTKLFNKHGSKVYAYDLSLVGSPLRSTVAMKLMIRKRRFELLAHPVTTYIVEAKFQAITKYLLFFRYFYMALLTFLYFITLSDVAGGLKGWTADLFGGKVFFQPSLETLIGAAMMLLTLIMHILNIELFLSFLIAFKMASKKQKTWRQRFKIFFSGHEALEDDDYYIIPTVCIIARDMLRYFGGPYNIHLTLIVSAVGFAALWKRCMVSVEGLFPSLGLCMSMVRQMYNDARIYFVALLFEVLGFSIVMNMLYFDSDVPEFSTLSDSFINLFMFVFNLDLASVQQDDVNARKYLAYIFLGFYMVLVVLTLTNLIIAAFTTSFTEIQGRAKQEMALSRARFVVFFEEHTELLSSFIESISPSCRRHSRLAACTLFKWEKAVFTGRRIPVREFPDGRVEMKSNCEILRYIYNERAPPYFLTSVWIYDLLNPFFGTGEKSSFDWSDVYRLIQSCEAGFYKSAPKSEAMDEGETKTLQMAEPPSTYDLNALSNPNYWYDFDPTEIMDVSDIMQQNPDISDLSSVPVILGEFYRDPSTDERERQREKAMKIPHLGRKAKTV